jgi:hypothetical protein
MLKTNNNGKKWAGFTVNSELAEVIKTYFKKHNIYYEPSSCYDAVYLEFLVTDAELKKVFEVLNDATIEQLKHFARL